MSARSIKVRIAASKVVFLCLLCVFAIALFRSITQMKQRTCQLCELGPNDYWLILAAFQFVWNMQWPARKKLWINRMLALCDLGLFFAMIWVTADIVWVCKEVLPQPTGASAFYVLVVLYFVYVIYVIWKKENRKKEERKKAEQEKLQKAEEHTSKEQSDSKASELKTLARVGM